MTRWIIALCVFFCVGAAAAQERSRAILVLDASGSMWGQIDGIAKITIAQDVIGGLLAELPPEQELGLTAYGHRRKGDCSDIETLITPDGDQRDAISQAVNAIKPKGKTPLSAAVIQAAEALRYTEEAATVILVSDGKETCEFDPCAVGRQLEEAGVNFTAHVIGFDVTAKEDREQLQCLAEETGGTFRTASSASELAEALTVVSAPPPAPADVTLQAIDGPGGPVITEGLTWRLLDNDGTGIEADLASHAPVVTLDPMTYSAEVVRAIDGAKGSATFEVQGESKVVTIVLPKVRAFDVTFNAKDGPGGPTITKGLAWKVMDSDGAVLLDGGNDFTPTLELFPGDYSVSVLREVDNASASRDFVIDGHDTIAVVLPKLPPEPRTVNYHARNGEKGKIIQDVLIWDIYAEDGTAVLESEQAAKGSVKLVPGTYRIEVLRPEDESTAEATFRLTSGNRTETLILPEFKFNASVSGPTSVPAGSMFEATWSGPDLQNDYIATALAGSKGNTWKTYTYTKDGSPVLIQAPAEPGDYELRYIQGKDREMLASVTLTVTPVEAILSPPSGATAGETVPVGWSGPDYPNDFISVAKRGEDKWINYAYTRDGDPVALVMPPEPGEYDILYIMSQKRTELARVPITVSAVSATVSPPAEAAAGSTIAVPWTGPDYQNDFIAVVEQGTKKPESYSFTRDGSPASLTLPADPGTYEILYVVNQDRTVLARVAISVTDVAASVTSPGEAVAGSTVDVPWTGPDYRNDFISVVKRGTDKPINYRFTRDGSPAQLLMPPEPGDYDILYVVNQDRTELAREPVTVTSASATLAAPAEAKAGSTVAIQWTGPDYAQDFISIVEKGKSKPLNYVFTRDGDPISLLMPTQPGEYDILYIVNQDRTELARVGIKVTAVTASVSAPPQAPVGSMVTVSWTGPDYARDFISIVARGEDKTLAYTNTRHGDPVVLQMPSQPGEYDILYVVNQDRTELARIPISLSDVTASVSAPNGLIAGETVSVDWTGPDYPRDYIAVVQRGQDKAVSYSNTRDGSPIQIRLPDAPGEYDILYVMNLDRRALVRIPVTVE